MTSNQKIVFVDVDETLVRNAGTKQIPIPHVINEVKRLSAEGAILYCWSSGGAEYCQRVTTELGITDCFKGFLPKPNIMIDDLNNNDWRYLTQIHPNEIS